MLRLTDLRKAFGGITAVDGLSLEVRRGEVFGLLGPNGAGKSTTIGMAIGQLLPDSGSVVLGDGGSPSDPACRARIGVAPQSLALYDELTGEENAAFFGRLFGLSGRVLRERVTDVLALVGLESRRRDRAGSYSGGMKRRLNFGVALVHDPDLLLLDEPTAGVDPQSRNNILELVREVANRGKTVVYTTHYMEEAQKVCDRVGIIDHGRLLALGTVQELIAAHGDESTLTLVGSGAESGDGERRAIRTKDPMGELRRQLAQGVEFRSVQIDRPDLESVFLSLTGRSLRD